MGPISDLTDLLRRAQECEAQLRMLERTDWKLSAARNTTLGGPEAAVTTLTAAGVLLEEHETLIRDTLGVALRTILRSLGQKIAETASRIAEGDAE